MAGPTSVSAANSPTQQAADKKAVDDAVYDKIPAHRKGMITFVLALCGFLAPSSSTNILAAVPEVAATFHTTGTVINLSNAIYLIVMAFSPCFWAPMSQVYGRRWICVSSAFMFFGFSLATAFSPNLIAFFVFRALTAFPGMSFLTVGSSVIGDIYRPTERATALSWFLSGTLVGPAVGPFIAGVIVTYESWNVIFYVQAALSGIATLLVIFVIPETIHHKRSAELVGMSGIQKTKKIIEWSNPFRVFKLYKYPNLLTTSLAAGALIWNMYTLLTPIRFVINPRFHLTSPMQSGLFYLAPGVGYITGTFLGGRWADRTVKKWIDIRGRRIPEDRLRSGLPFMAFVIPGCMLIYGWSIEKKKGGIVLPVIVMFVQGVSQLFCFPSLNTYCLDVMQSRSAEVVAGNYITRYTFAAIGSAVVLPAVKHIGVGWVSTISALFVFLAAIMIHFTTLYGESWRDWIDGTPATAVPDSQSSSVTLQDKERV
ncbi:unnamed protein product [Mycena citricolor]|uniref:Major facilitator superfamily (MFS) profile domain-containing protein n=1 Tax=Mycena citricolor TaxID=2018698 RepID=A0AAD2HRU0_9AGAR|nr:unnamed protein product [Mycena citricolor]